MAQLTRHNKSGLSVNELARDFATELIRWRGNMQPEAIVGEAFALARAFEKESQTKETTDGEGQ